MTTATPPHVVVIGGGIAGLAAAFYLRDEPVRVTVLEGSPRLGGKLSASDVAGRVDGRGGRGAARPPARGHRADRGGRPRPPTWCRPASPRPRIYTRGALRPLPRRQFMGVPADLDELAATGVVSAEGSPGPGPSRRRRPRAADASVTAYIGARLGVEVVDRLVDPLLGGVYAGRSEDLSFQATLAPLAAASPRPPDADRGRRRPAAARPQPACRPITARSRRRSSSPSPPGSARCRRRWPRRPAPTSASTRWSAS